MAYLVLKVGVVAVAPLAPSVALVAMFKALHEVLVEALLECCAFPDVHIIGHKIDSCVDPCAFSLCIKLLVSNQGRDLVQTWVAIHFPEKSAEDRSLLLTSNAPFFISSEMQPLLFCLQ